MYRNSLFCRHWHCLTAVVTESIYVQRWKFTKMSEMYKKFIQIQCLQTVIFLLHIMEINTLFLKHESLLFSHILIILNLVSCVGIRDGVPDPRGWVRFGQIFINWAPVQVGLGHISMFNKGRLLIQMYMCTCNGDCRSEYFNPVRFGHCSVRRGLGSDRKIWPDPTSWHIQTKQ